MREQEVRALVSLIADEDKEVIAHVKDKIMSLGPFLIPYLEQEWEEADQDSHVQYRIEELIHQLQFDLLKKRFADFKQQPNPDLLEGLWLIATYQYPNLELEAIKANLQKLYYQVWISLQPAIQPLEQIRQLNQILFDQLQFGPNTRNFHASSNSMINIVLETRKGNPISLCVIYMLIAQKLKWPVYGVNLPNLFILIYQNIQAPFYINVFNKGIIYVKTDIDRYIESLKLEKLDVFYQPCHALDIVRRMLRNLAYSYQQEKADQKNTEILQLLQVLADPDMPPGSIIF